MKKSYLIFTILLVAVLSLKSFSQGCTTGNVLTAASGTISDGSGSSNYAMNANCSWIIQPPGATSITITFTAFATEANYDFVKIYNGTNATGTLLGTYSGTTLPSALTVPSGYAFVEFTSDNIVAAAGFSLNYTSSSAPPANFCSGNQLLTASTGTITDGSGTSNYNINADCSWLIQPPGASQITITFTAFDTEASYDFVTIYSGTDTTGILLGSYSGSTLPPTITVPTGSAYIRFTSDYIVNAAGFSLNYTSTTAPPANFCSGNQTLTTAAGTITDGSGTSNYGNNSNCSWLIQPTGATSITINFTQFATELSNDFVSIYSGTNSSGTLIGTYSGAVLPSTINVPSGNAFVSFTSNGSITSGGFSFNYTSGNTPVSFCSGNQILTASSGTITDGSGTSDYVVNTDCSWLIQPLGATSITLTFTAFATEATYDFVYIYNGTDTTGTLLGTYSGTTLPAALTVPSGNAYIRFTSDNIINAAGFSLNYTSSSAPPANFCSGNQVLTASTGTITDGSGTSNYNINADCSWLIQPPGASQITITFTAFATEANYDFVKIYNGTDTTGILLGSYSGTIIPSAITVPSGNVFIRFTSDYIVTAAGFSLNYSSTTTPPANFCSGNQTLTTATGTITDGSGASNYGNNSNCSWLIQPTGATSITINFTQFATELSNDLVSIYNGTNSSGTLIGTYSGTVLPPTINVPSGNAFISFTSNGSITAGGFSLNYISGTTPVTFCSGTQTLTASSGTVTDGSGNAQYGLFSDCSWLIQPSGATSITITFTAFATELNYDFVRIYSGTDTTGALIGQYSGTTIPTALTIPSGSVFVRFTSDYSQNAAGFSFDYTSSSTPPANFCSGNQTLTTATGTITDGSGTSNYGNNSNCSWLIQPAGATSITITFSALSTELNQDFVKVYSGTNASGTLLGNYSGSTLPSVLTIPSGNVFISFTSNNSITAAGFSLSYTSSSTPLSFCGGNPVFTAPSGTINDGSGTAEYLDNTYCTWLIQPTGVQQILLSFTAFATELNYDFVDIYNGTDTSGVLLGSYSGSTLPPNITVNSGNAFVVFRSDGSITASGFSLNYTTCTSPPTVSLLPPSTTVFCPPAGILLTANPSIGVNSIVWNINGTPVTGNNTTTLTANVGGQYHVKVTDSQGCAGFSDTIQITNASSPLFVLANPPQICDGGNTTLFANTDFVSENFDASIGQMIVNGGVVASTCGSFSGNALYFNGTLRNVSTPTLNTSSGGTIAFYLKISNGIAPCEAAESGDAVVLSYSVNGGNTWQDIATYAPGSFNNFTLVSLPIPTLALTPNTIFRWSQPINSGPGFDNWALDNIQVSGLSNNLTYSWSPSTGLSSTTIPNPVCSATATTTYTVTANNGVCSSSAQLTINVSTTPQVNITPSGPTTLCPGGSVTLVADSSLTYLWSNGATTRSIVVNQAGTFSFSANQGGGCIGVSPTVTVTLASNPNASITAGGNTSICNGSSINIISNQGSGITSQWLRNGMQILNATGSSFQANQAGSYAVIQTNAAGCRDTSNNIIISDRTPNATVTANPPSICAGSSSQLNTIILGFADNFDGATMPWVINGGTITSGGCGSFSGNALYFDGTIREAITPDINTSGGGNITFYLEIGNGSVPCEAVDPGEDILLEFSNNNGLTWTGMGTYAPGAYDTFTPVVVSIPAAAQTVSTRFRWSQPAQSGAGFDNWAIDNVQIQLSGNNLTYAWSPASGLSATNIANPIANPNNTTTYQVTVTNNNCSVSFPVAVSIINTNTASISSSPTGNNLCFGDSLYLFATGGASYLWSNGDTSQTIRIGAPGSYSVQVTYPGGCSSTSAPFQVIQNTLSASISQINPGCPSCCDGSVTLTPTDGVLPYQYSWTPATGSGQGTPTLSGLCEGIYLVTVTDAVGCSAQNGANLLAAPTSLKDTPGEMDIRVFPNPFDHRFTLVFNNNTFGTVVLLQDMLGKTLTQKILQGENTVLFETEKLSPGIYFLEIREGEKRILKKIIRN
ncbi:MAG: CUB domain-containing protein [Bacteroidota bacterium]